MPFFFQAMHSEPQSPAQAVGTPVPVSVLSPDDGPLSSHSRHLSEPGESRRNSNVTLERNPFTGESVIFVVQTMASGQERKRRKAPPAPFLHASHSGVWCLVSAPCQDLAPPEQTQGRFLKI